LAVPEELAVDGSAGFSRLPGGTDEQDRRYYAVTIRPQVFVNLVPDHVILHRMIPLGPGRTTVMCDWLFDAGVVAAGGTFPVRSSCSTASTGRTSPLASAPSRR
jgi:Ring hydroxylating alpha subunit (catalytic domain)